VNWSTTKDLKAKRMRVWERGDLLREALTDNHRFPLRLSLKAPDSADLSSRFDEVRLWAAELRANPVLRLEFREIQHRVRGAQRLPASAWIDSLEDALSWLNKRGEWNRFLSLIETTRHSLPGLLPWMEEYPLEALELANDWRRLLAVVAWLIDNPRPNIYLRQVDLPGLHAKFIGAHRGVLAELLDLALPSEIADNTKSGSRQFTARYGFLDKPVLIRFRVLAEASIKVPEEPVIFAKPTRAVCGPNDDVVIPRGSEKMDWGVELVMVIGSPAKYLSPEEALSYVAGYCVINDVSERAFQLEGTGQWTKGKGADTSGPIGPWLITTDEITDPQNLDMWLEVNGRRFQNGNTRTMVFGVAHLISYLSHYRSLQPGDVISTGTPPGEGMGQRPSIDLSAADSIQLGIQGLGVQRQNVVADAVGGSQYPTESRGLRR
jgi:2-keto-4-pentenoate hydratase/2-oxohepta-3-ene-1,7-dioic acid hydratase in catechol pathway